MDFKYYVNSQDSGRTVKSILINNFELSKNLIQKLKYKRKILCNKVPVYIDHIVASGDIVEACANFTEQSANVTPQKMDLSILYEDDYIIALDKPAGIIVHPTSPKFNNTIANGLVYYFQSKGLQIKIRPVSRLDRDTTGVIVFAKNQFVQDRLIKQMNTNQYRKEYIGIVHGYPVESSGTINLPIAKTAGSIISREVSEFGAPSITHYTSIEHLNNSTMMNFTLETGRTHQIRVHCQSIGLPLIGDTLYSNIATTLISRQALHAHYVKFIHPITKKIVEITSPLPKDINELLDILRK